MRMRRQRVRTVPLDPLRDRILRIKVGSVFGRVDQNLRCLSNAFQGMISQIQTCQYSPQRLTHYEKLRPCILQIANTT